jgi:hypothetical protein
MLKRMQFLSSLHSRVLRRKSTRKIGHTTHNVSNKVTFHKAASLCTGRLFQLHAECSALETYDRHRWCVALRVQPCIERLGEVGSCLERIWILLESREHGSKSNDDIPTRSWYNTWCCCFARSELFTIFKISSDLLDLAKTYTWIHWASIRQPRILRVSCCNQAGRCHY